MAGLVITTVVGISSCIPSVFEAFEPQFSHQTVDSLTGTFQAEKVPELAGSLSASPQNLVELPQD
jgi:hypothetical protein